MIVFLLLLLFGLFIYCYHHPLTHSNTMTHYVEEFLSFHLNGLFCHLSERIKTKTKQERKFSSGFFLSVIFSLFFCFVFGSIIITMHLFFSFCYLLLWCVVVIDGGMAPLISFFFSLSISILVMMMMIMILHCDRM